MLVVFGAAVAGVLVEAFAPRSSRRAAHLVLTLGSLIAAFILTIVVAARHSLYAAGSPGHVAAEGAVAVDRPTLFIQGTIVILALVSVLLIADTSNSPFAAVAAATPGSQEEREGLAAGTMHTEIFPLTLFAVASAAASNTSSATLLFTGIALTGVGLLFKIGAVPFHGWKPEVYQGAPTPITALMASCTVVSAFGA